MEALNQRVAVITGAAGGIGRAMADEFGRAGMKLVLVDTAEAALAVAVDDLRASDIDAIGMPTDVADADQVADLAQTAIDAYGAVHLVCNNAGVMAGAARSWEGSVEDWQWVFDVNFWGVLNGVRVFTPILLNQGFGHIVNTSSIGGLWPYPGGSMYCASKAAIISLSEILHHEVKAAAPNVGVSLVCPASVNTGGWRRAHSTGRSMISRNDPGCDPGESGLQLTGIDTVDTPDKVAVAVHGAVLEDRFWVFPQPQMKEQVRARMERLLSEQPPALPPIELPAGRS